jgi:hypothetical protein
LPASDLHVVVVDQQDPRLGRQCVQDPASRGFPMGAADTHTWHTHVIRIYDPLPNPNQKIGNCTTCDKAMEGNAAGNRVTGRILAMADADQIYPIATQLDPWDGQWPPTDTGSSGLAASKAAQRLRLGGEYRWALAGGADAVVQQIMEGRRSGAEPGGSTACSTASHSRAAPGSSTSSRPGPAPVATSTGPAGTTNP